MIEYDTNRFDKAFDIAKCRESAESGYARAQYNLGECYHQHWAQAVKWYRKAADQGLPEAFHSLGNCYIGGFGVPKDREQAFAYYRKAVDAGDETAQWLLDFYTEYGERHRQSDEQNEGDNERARRDEWKLRWSDLCQHKLAHANLPRLKYDLERAFQTEIRVVDCMVRASAILQTTRIYSNTTRNVHGWWSAVGAYCKFNWCAV